MYLHELLSLRLLYMFSSEYTICMWCFTSGKECCHILLQTIPGHIDVEEFQARFLQEFPAILNVHHLHIWTFTPENVYFFNLSSTCNISHLYHEVDNICLATKDFFFFGSLFECIHF